MALTSTIVSNQYFNQVLVFLPAGAVLETQTMIGLGADKSDSLYFLVEKHRVKNSWF